MNAIHGDCSLLRDIEEQELLRAAKRHAPLCCQECRDLFPIVVDERFDAWRPDGKSRTYGDKMIYPGCRKSDAEIDIHDGHCDRLIQERAGRLVEDLEQFTREMTERLEDLRDAINNFLEDIA